MTEREQIQSALRFLDSDSREDWVRVGMAIKSFLGDGGKDLWFDWSAGSDKFRPRDAEVVWRSFRDGGGGVGIGTLFKMAREAGWKGTWEPAPQRTTTHRPAPQDYDAQHQKAAEAARKVIAGTVWGPSGYLLDKGFTGAAARGNKRGEDLIIPMHDYWSGKAMAYQMITPEGEKKYQPFGCRVSETCYVMNRQPHPDVQWWCEGYATGTAILEALKYGYRFNDQVVVCFFRRQPAEARRPSPPVAVHGDGLGGGGSRLVDVHRQAEPPVGGCRHDVSRMRPPGHSPARDDGRARHRVTLVATAGPRYRRGRLLEGLRSR